MPMSVQNAIRFIVQLRTNEELKKQLVSLDDVPELDNFVRLGGKIGLSFTSEELRAAHKHDWGMRDISYDDWQPSSISPD